mmetsp:Transcript_33663/g.68822  ORF Transcript_33663/g.68822 Transcript_33663/m.68822 type:complete len:219 (-) Transcript_33663:1226-1882(-)
MAGTHTTRTHCQSSGDRTWLALQGNRSTSSTSKASTSNAPPSRRHPSSYVSEAVKAADPTTSPSEEDCSFSGSSAALSPCLPSASLSPDCCLGPSVKEGACSFNFAKDCLLFPFFLTGVTPLTDSSSGSTALAVNTPMSRAQGARMRRMASPSFTWHWSSPLSLSSPDASAVAGSTRQWARRVEQHSSMPTKVEAEATSTATSSFPPWQHALRSRTIR